MSTAKDIEILSLWAKNFIADCEVNILLNGEHLKFGITKNPGTGYISAELKGGRLNIVAQGSCHAMLQLERKVHSTLPIRPEDRQKAYINVQAAQDYKVSPST
ncbi:MAG: hypothetical protein JJT82_07435 [Legionellaceae bacterium]|nr:hypothetical protein [Legionellaceae bacterium]